MKNSGLIIIVIIALIIVGGLAYYFLSMNSLSDINNTNTNQPSSNNQPSTNTETNNQPESNNIITETTSTPKTYDVEIKNFAFSPSSLTIKKGDSIRWTNRDSVDHTATSDNNAFDSPLLSDDESFTFTFNNAGEFSYYCKPHPYMKAKIIVE
ncbi:cupredoxin family copper-binding protein [Candidatus Pacearchaeota archaeon]|nr:cupredoxin family copper-binding protein [Candidatus Pacearchaeota archaeon]